MNASRLFTLLRLSGKKRLGVVILTALAFTTTFAEESGHLRYISEQLEQLEQLLNEAAQKADDREKILAEIQRRFEVLKKETYDETKGESEICPVHRIKMPVKDAPIDYGLRSVSEPQPGAETRSRKFPFARARIIGGCMVPSDPPRTGQVFLCPKCVAAQKAWIESHQKKGK
jgi:hypothetical protein